MSDALTRPSFPGGIPFCIKCNKNIDSVEYKLPVETVHSWDGSAQSRYTGELRITVKCHGETWQDMTWFVPS